MTVDAMKPDQAIQKFQDLLRHLFQFDCADLDFGIYRIMNHKRELIDQFITEDLPAAIKEELERGMLAYQSQVSGELQALSEEVRQTLGQGALNTAGDLAETYHDTPLGKSYLEAKSKAGEAKGGQALETEIFNHLYSFFSRYYDDGDFVSKRRYSKREKYAIPHNGEEVSLHWANHDQYYVKSAEHFYDYSFDARGVTVHFKIVSAKVEQNDTLSNRRLFLPKAWEIDWDDGDGTLIIPFEYRQLTDQEIITYGKRNQQTSINAKTLEEIPKQLIGSDKALVALTAERHKSTDGTPVSFFEHHLRQYTRKNSSDFFIHKDLKGFLTRELDFYLKNEVINLDELEISGEARVEGWFQVMRAIKSVGRGTIDFLAQIENFQKMLWTKRKFITATHYCITLSNIDAEFYPEIALCDSQWKEWNELGLSEGKQIDSVVAGKSEVDKRIEFLVSNPALMLDTKNFEPDFVDRLIAIFEDIDNITDGLVVNSENFQAVNLLMECYRSQIECIHIDPPYNTQTSGFLYKNAYQHSSWLAMMHDRIGSAIPLMSPDGAFLSHIDENEYEVLHLLCSQLGIPDNGTIIWDKKNPMLGRGKIATQHEYILWRTWGESAVYLQPNNVHMILEKASSLVLEHGTVNEETRKGFKSWISSCEGLSGGERAYSLLDDVGNVYQSVAMGAPEPRTDPKFYVPLVHPITKKSCPVPGNGWSRTPENLSDLVEKGEIVFGKDESTQPRKKVVLTDQSKRKLSSVISDGGRGKTDVAKLGLEFPYCHPVSLYENLLGAAAPSKDDKVLDHFAGSGTTGHAVINLNREDGGRRKFILVETGQYVDTVLLPRIKKITFCPEWKDGRPSRMPTTGEQERGPRIVKYLKLESYEDTLNNIAFQEPKGQLALEFEDYLLKYLLQWETRASETLLNVEKLSNPFDYNLHVREGGEASVKVVDLPETFNYLVGFHASTRLVAYDGERRYLVYRGNIDNRTVAVIWRTTEGWTQKDLTQDQKFVAEKKFSEGFDEVFVNGDSFIPNAKALEPLFKARMFSALET